MALSRYSFVNKVTSAYWHHPDMDMSQLEFVNMKVKDQQLELWNEIKSLKQEVKIRTIGVS